MRLQAPPWFIIPLCPLLSLPLAITPLRLLFPSCLLTVFLPAEPLPVQARLRRPGQRGLGSRASGLALCWLIICLLLAFPPSCLLLSGPGSTLSFGVPGCQAQQGFLRTGISSEQLALWKSPRPFVTPLPRCVRL